MPKTSAGLLAYRWRAPGEVLEVLLVHPGGPYFAKKDAGAWSIPKGELEDEGEDALAAAIREFTEETGMTPDECAVSQGDRQASGSGSGAAAPRAAFVALGAVKMQRHKIVHAWAFEGDCDPRDVQSNTFTIEWPPRSGRQQDFPEADRAAWFELPEAREAINQSQRRFLDDLEGRLRPPGAR